MNKISVLAGLLSVLVCTQAMASGEKCFAEVPETFLLKDLKPGMLVDLALTNRDVYRKQFLMIQKSGLGSNAMLFPSDQPGSDPTERVQLKITSVQMPITLVLKIASERASMEYYAERVDRLGVADFKKLFGSTARICLNDPNAEVNAMHPARDSAATHVSGEISKSILTDSVTYPMGSKPRTSSSIL